MRLLLLPLIGLLVSSCQTRHQVRISPNEWAVMTTFIETNMETSFGNDFSPPNADIILIESTVVQKGWPGEEEEMSRLRKSAETAPPEVRETVEDFVLKNQEPRSLKKLQLKSKPVETVTLAKLGPILEAHELRAQEGIREGISYVGLSRVGFSKDGNLAIFYIEQRWSSSVAHGGTHWMRRENNRWIPAKVGVGSSWVY